MSGQRYALDEFDLPALPLARSDAVTVEAIRETPIARHPHDIFEHRLHPDTVEERLDSGPLVTVPRDPALRLEPGQRVRVTLPEAGAR